MSDVGDVIDERYRLERVVGSGGMGVVYLATDLQTGAHEAVKVLRTAVDTSDDVRARITREIELLSRLHSPYIAELRATGFLTDGSPYFVMEFLEGRDLKAELRERGPLPCAEAVAYVVQACRGISVAHRLGIVHRDLKPHNLFVTGLNGVRAIKVVDFGVAKSLDATDPGLTATNTSVGTPLYMSPEQLLEARTVSERTDVWALGVILYELLAGFSPFTDESPGAVIAAVTLDDPYPIQKLRPDVPVGVARAIDAALVKLPSERLGSVEELEQLLAMYATPDAALTVTEVEQREPSRSIARPQRNRVSAYLMERILVSIDAASRQDRATIRCLPAASADSSLPIQERLSLVPTLQSLAPGLPGMIHSAAVADTRPVSLTQPSRISRLLKLPVFLASVLALILVVAFWRSSTHQPASGSTVLDALERGESPGGLLSSETPQPTAGSETKPGASVAQLTAPLAPSPTVSNAATTERRQPRALSALPTHARRNVAIGAAAGAANPTATSASPSVQMVPKHL